LWELRRMRRAAQIIIGNEILNGMTKDKNLDLMV
jgi:molybdopterin-biosynthesis enzyme MoeA-like protein